MATAKSKLGISPRALDAERIIEEYYDKLQHWGAVLSRGDRTMAQEIVHDLCLHFIIARPDLSQVANLDGYLYTCLRHLYLSAIARSSREALQTVGIADFDSVQFALDARTSDSLLDRQNELRRICNYAVWRKDSSKSASYFLLLFFHGHTRRAVAEIAQLPLAAIYNKLKVARQELAAHLQTSAKLRIATRDLPPSPELRVSVIASTELFQELRKTIFAAKSSECLTEESLLARYCTTIRNPLPCSLLSHIVSCERCLSLLDRRFHRPASEDGEPPANPWKAEDDDGSGAVTRGASGYHAMMSEVRRHRDRIYEHRPQTLSIATNGKIVAFHDVQSERSTLASRAEHPEAVQWVEVFTDQQIRLALLPIEELPPGGMQVRTQAVALSDGRQLELTVSLDGQGLHSEVTYLDPSLAVEILEKAEEDAPFAIQSAPPLASLSAMHGQKGFGSIGGRIARVFHTVRPRFALAWATLLVVVLGGTGYLVYRFWHAPLDARTILNNSVSIEAANEKGQAEHRLLKLDVLDASGRTVWQGTVDDWDEQAKGRTMRRLYNAQHHLLAAAWHGQNGEDKSFKEPVGDAVSQTDREVAESEFWMLDVSARVFQTMASQHIEMRTVGSDYELTGSGPSSEPFHFVSATLVLSRRLHIVGETLHMRSGYEFTEARFVEASDDRLPADSVPSSTFDPSDLESRMKSNPFAPSARDRGASPLADADPRLVQTQIDVLYRLSKLGADVGIPIDIVRTPTGRIRVAGTITSEDLKKRIIAVLENEPNRQFVEIDLLPEENLRIPVPATRLAAPPTDVYNLARTVPPAAPNLRAYFAAKGMSQEQIDSAVAQFSSDALDHAQRALQDAYALDRLGSSFSAKEFMIMGPVAQQQWSAMVARHSSELANELNGLRQQLAPLNLAGRPGPWRGRFSKIDSPPDFASSARRLLLQTQDLNRTARNAFSSGVSGAAAPGGNASIEAVWESIPLRDAEEVTEFASHLTNARDSANSSAERYPR
ncbi:MAG: hypothetical protein ABSD59_00080 [Terracidiphilus sp.]|jgi:DNA-directed RNA polymerase specialized sigma24 family protein